MHKRQWLDRPSVVSVVVLLLDHEFHEVPIATNCPLSVAHCHTLELLFGPYQIAVYLSACLFLWGCVLSVLGLTMFSCARCCDLLLLCFEECTKGEMSSGLILRVLSSLELCAVLISSEL